MNDGDPFESEEALLAAFGELESLSRYPAHRVTDA